MKNTCLILLLFINVCASAQVCSTHTKNGRTTRYASVQFGKDTIVMNVPYKTKDKLGMSLLFRTDGVDSIHFTANIRSISPGLMRDSILLRQSTMRITLANGDTVNIFPNKETATRYNLGLLKNRFGVNLFFSSYINHLQLIKLAKSRLDKVYFCRDSNSSEEMPITRHEMREFRYAINYLLGQ